MVTRRTVLKKGGCIALASAVPLFIRTARAQSATTFNYYISPTGSNSNPGTLASPWAISALNSLGSTYAGKSIGFLPGNYSAYALCQASGVGGGDDYCAYSIQGGTASSPTYIGSSNAQGAYSPRLAILDAHRTISAITAISQGATTTVTVNSSAGSNPFSSGQIVAINGVQGMTQINGLYLTVGNLGGSSGNWTFTVNNGVGGSALNSLGFGAYTSGGYAGQGYPSSECGILGQLSSQSGRGNVTIDGLVLTGSYESAINIYGASSGSEGGAGGVSIQNCEIWDISGYWNDNVAGISCKYLTGMLVHNCKIHQIIPTSGSGADCFGINVFNCYSNIYEYNTIYNSNIGICDKNSSNGNHTHRYNYIEQSASVGPNYYQCIAASLGGLAGDTHTIHHNILIGPDIWNGDTAGAFPSPEKALFYNNTCYGSFNSTGATWCPVDAINGFVTHYNNIYYCTGTPNYQGFIQFTTGGIRLSDYNAYNLNGSYFVLGNGSGGYAGIAYTFANWKTTTGADTHSVIGSPSFASPTSLNPNGYQLNAGAGKGTGSTTGTSGGTACDMGAWGFDPALGGPPTQIGCNFGSVPNANVTPNPPVIVSIS